MDCTEARADLLGRRRATLSPARLAEVERHLAACEACRQEDSADRELSILLEHRLPRARTPDSLRAALHARWGAPRRWGRRGALLGAMTTLAAGAALALAVLFLVRARMPDEGMVAEAVNDHLRVLYSQHPLEVESGGIHQVKPWFEGRLDFAPVTGFAGDDQFPLQGGLIGYFVDRKAATLVFKRRLHVISLFVFQSQGFKWPAVGLRPIGTAAASLATSRGFHVLLWREGDLGYALVSDVDEQDLLTLASKIAAP